MPEQRGILRRLPMMHTVILAGEALTSALCDKAWEQHPGLHILNLYGPTEAAVYATGGEVAKGERVTIGRALQNCRALVLNEAMLPALVGEVGELYLGGRCLAHGYCQREDLTARAFIDDPLGGEETLYRTGDLVRLCADGRLEYIGRRDNQIKLNGQRVELEEINAVARSFQNVGECATVALPGEGGSLSLCLFLVPKQGTVNQSGLREALEHRLPPYMVPGMMRELEAMPRTTSGKVDQLALRALLTAPPMETTPALQPIATAQPAPQQPAPEPMEPPTPTPQPIEPPTPSPQPTEMPPAPTIQTGAATPEQVRAVWQRVLGRQDIDEQRSFFEQGGTSLGALNLLSLYFNHGWTMSIQGFYESPTLCAQIARLCPSESTGEVHDEVPLPPLQEEGVHDEANLQLNSAPIAVRDRVVLLTGGTGFLGTQLIQSLLEAGAAEVRCLCREPGRLEESLAYAFEKTWIDAHRPRITAVRGDISLPDLGVSDESTLLGVSVVVHAAAQVSHYASDDRHERTNVEGTANVIACAQRLKAALVHISSISVGAASMKDPSAGPTEFDEAMFLFGQDDEGNAYVRSKIEGERLVRDAMAHGLSAKIMRIGRLVGRESDGLYQRNAEQNALFGFAQAIGKLGLLPATLSALPLELTPVDAAATAVVTLLGSELPVCHVIHPQPLSLGQFARLVSKDVRVVSNGAFEAALAQALKLEPSALLFTANELYQKQKSQRSPVVPVCRMTVQTLALGGYVWHSQGLETALRAFVQPTREGV